MFDSYVQEKLEISEARVRELQAELASARALSQQREAPTPLSATSRRVRELEEQLGQSREMLRGKLLLEETAASLRAQLITSSKAAEQLATLQELTKVKTYPRVANLLARYLCSCVELSTGSHQI